MAAFLKLAKILAFAANVFLPANVTITEHVAGSLERPLDAGCSILTDKTSVSGRTAQWRNIPLAKGSANSNRAVAHPLQYRQAAQRLGIPATSAGKHRSDGPEADHALTFSPDHPMGALQDHSKYRECKTRMSVSNYRTQKL